MPSTIIALITSIILYPRTLFWETYYSGGCFVNNLYALCPEHIIFFRHIILGCLFQMPIPKPSWLSSEFEKRRITQSCSYCIIILRPKANIGRMADSQDEKSLHLRKCLWVAGPTPTPTNTWTSFTNTKKPLFKLLLMWTVSQQIHFKWHIYSPSSPSLLKYAPLIYDFSDDNDFHHPNCILSFLTTVIPFFSFNLNNDFVPRYI